MDKTTYRALAWLTVLISAPAEEFVSNRLRHAAEALDDQHISTLNEDIIDAAIEDGIYNLLDLCYDYRDARDAEDDDPVDLITPYDDGDGVDFNEEVAYRAERPDADPIAKRLLEALWAIEDIH